MNDQIPTLPQIPATTTGKLIDFVHGCEDGSALDIEVAIKEDGHVVLFHNKPFRNELSWLEFDLRTNELDFVLDDGLVRDVGLPLSQGVAKYMQNTHQLLMVLIDANSGEAKEGKYIPLVVHRS